MKFTVQVDQCQQCCKSQANGLDLICTLSGKKENFYGECPNFAQVGTQSAAIPPKVEEQKGKVKEKSSRLVGEIAEYDKAGSTSGTGKIFLGILMIIGAFIWFFGGLAAGIIFYYPPVLLIIGIITIVKGSMKK